MCDRLTQVWRAQREKTLTSRRTSQALHEQPYAGNGWMERRMHGPPHTRPYHIRVDSWRELSYHLLGRRPFTFRDNSSSLSHFLPCSTNAQMPSRPHPRRHALAILAGTLSRPISILCAPSSNPNPPVPYLGSPAQARRVDERMSGLLLRRGRSWLCETCGDPRKASK